jgi:hypothetical protein
VLKAQNGNQARIRQSDMPRIGSGNTKPKIPNKSINTKNTKYKVVDSNHKRNKSSLNTQTKSINTNQTKTKKKTNAKQMQTELNYCLKASREGQKLK